MTSCSQENCRWRSTDSMGWQVAWQGQETHWQHKPVCAGTEHWHRLKNSEVNGGTHHMVHLMTWDLNRRHPPIKIYKMSGKINHSDGSYGVPLDLDQNCVLRWCCHCKTIQGGNGVSVSVSMKWRINSPCNQNVIWMCPWHRKGGSGQAVKI